MAKDDGSAQYAIEMAVEWIACAWWRRTHDEKKNGGFDMLALAAAARDHITAEQWKDLGC